MGSCLSSESGDPSRRHLKPSAANVVLANGELRQYFLPITVSQVLHSQNSSPDAFFLCNSDNLYFDDYIPSLLPNDELEPAQIYFLLPTAKLQYRLAASDMAALAVKASAALEHINASNRRRNRKTRISPVLVSEEDPQSNHTVNQNKISGGFKNDYKSKSSSSWGVLGVSRSGSVRKLTRYSSRRAKLAVRSFKNKLSTIYEGSVHAPPPQHQHQQQSLMVY
ncbi:hypothetical protein Sango_2060800 [Sesamum angolense]|uniref:Poly polymerase n=1 Tax=Sesamum angolense TaxID=2727404 RepID=A0AAE2BLQ1_9LAMI|nr:hypothetical protein Sango_2060800 [Sesamum angolense]